MKYRLLILTANVDLGLLKSIQSVALIVFGRDLAMKVLVTQSSVLSFVFATC